MVKRREPPSPGWQCTSLSFGTAHLYHSFTRDPGRTSLPLWSDLRLSVHTMVLTAAAVFDNICSTNDPFWREADIRRSVGFRLWASAAKAAGRSRTRSEQRLHVFAACH